MIQRFELLGLPLSQAQNEEMLLATMAERLTRRRPLTVTFVNPHAWALAERHPDYRSLLRSFDLVLADGIGVVKAASWTLGVRLPRFSFDATSLYRPVMSLLDRTHSSLFVIGGVPGVAARAARRIGSEFKDLHISGTRDGFGSHDEAIALILESNPSLVLCGMGAPHQERFLMRLKAAGYGGLGVSCGGFLDQLAASPSYYPAWIDALDLRWAYRLWREPRRLLRRYAMDYQVFARLVAGSLARNLVLGTPPVRSSAFRTSELGEQP